MTDITNDIKEKLAEYTKRAIKLSDLRLPPNLKGKREDVMFIATMEMIEIGNKLNDRLTGLGQTTTTKDIPDDATLNRLTKTGLIEYIKTGQVPNITGKDGGNPTTTKPEVTE
jgi:hypothetical protein